MTTDTTEPGAGRPPPPVPGEVFHLDVRSDEPGATFNGVPTKFEWRIRITQPGLPEHVEPWAPLAPDIREKHIAQAVARTLSMLVIAKIQGASAELLPGETRPGRAASPKPRTPFRPPEM